MFVDRSVVMPIFHRLLKDGGKLILGATNTPQRWHYKFQKGKRDQLDNPNFFRFCEQGMNGLTRETGVNAFGATIEENTAIADRYGFSVEYADYDGQIGLHGEEPLYFEPDVARENQNAEILMRKVTVGASG